MGSLTFKGSYNLYFQSVKHCHITVSNDPSITETVITWSDDLKNFSVENQSDQLLFHCTNEAMIPGNVYIKVPNTFVNVELRNFCHSSINFIDIYGYLRGWYVTYSIIMGTISNILMDHMDFCTVQSQCLVALSTQFCDNNHYFVRMTNISEISMQQETGSVGIFFDGHLVQYFYCWDSVSCDLTCTTPIQSGEIRGQNQFTLRLAVGNTLTHDKCVMLNARY